MLAVCKLFINFEILLMRLSQLMSENTDFTVVGVLGPPGVGKSTIMNELYGFDGTTTGWLSSSIAF